MRLSCVTSTPMTYIRVKMSLQAMNKREAKVPIRVLATIAIAVVVIILVGTLLMGQPSKQEALKDSNVEGNTQSEQQLAGESPEGCGNGVCSLSEQESLECPLDCPICEDFICGEGEDDPDSAYYCPEDCALETCEPNWDCGDWDICNTEGKQRRNCIDKNKCGNSESKPEITKTCAEIESFRTGEDVRNPKIWASKVVWIEKGDVHIRDLETGEERTITDSGGVIDVDVYEEYVTYAYKDNLYIYDLTLDKETRLTCDKETYAVGDFIILDFNYGVIQYSGAYSRGLIDVSDIEPCQEQDMGRLITIKNRCKSEYGISDFTNDYGIGINLAKGQTAEIPYDLFMSYYNDCVDIVDDPYKINTTPSTQPMPCGLGELSLVEIYDNPSMKVSWSGIVDLSDCSREELTGDIWDAHTPWGDRPEKIIGDYGISFRDLSNTIFIFDMISEDYPININEGHKCFDEHSSIYKDEYGSTSESYYLRDGYLIVKYQIMDYDGYEGIKKIEFDTRECKDIMAIPLEMSDIDIENNKILWAEEGEDVLKDYGPDVGQVKEGYTTIYVATIDSF